MASSGHVAFYPAFAQIEGRGVKKAFNTQIVGGKSKKWVKTSDQLVQNWSQH